MINKTIRILNGTLGRLTSMQGDSVGYIKDKIKMLEELKKRNEEKWKQ